MFKRIFLLLFASLFTVQALVDDSCPCRRDGLRPCSGSVYVDYYYNPPYVGAPRDPHYLPPEESVPKIVQNVTNIRDLVNDFLNTYNQQSDNSHKALWLYQNFNQVRYLIRAVDRAANKTHHAHPRISD